MTRAIDNAADNILAIYDRQAPGPRRRLVLQLAEELLLWKWTTDNGCTVQRNSIVGLQPWVVLDVDGVILGYGDTPADAIRQAIEFTC